MESPLHSATEMGDPSTHGNASPYTSYTSDPSLEAQHCSDPVVSDNLFQGSTRIPHASKWQQTPPSSLDSVGQFSFAPATQTTVVTTTTTTTTSFPPLVIKAPSGLQALDTKLYPLAASPTPQTLKRFCFDIGGRPTVFREADNAAASLQKFEQQQRDLQDSNGVLRFVTKTTPSIKPSRTKPHESKIPSQQQNRMSVVGSSVRRDLSPISISEAVKLAGSQPISKRHPSGTAKRGFPRAEPSESINNSSRLHICQTSTPMTPSLDLGRTSEGPTTRFQAKVATSEWGLIEPDNTPSELRSRTLPRTLSPLQDDNQNVSFAADCVESLGNSFDYTTSSDFTSNPIDSVKNSTQPSTEEQLPETAHILPHFRPRPAILDTTAAQDMSLPSPSLSPVTAAAQLQNRRSYFEDSLARVPNEPLALSSPPREATEEDDIEYPGELSTNTLQNGMDTSRRASLRGPGLLDQQLLNASMMQIPDILDSFEAMPAEMKSYVIYQLLRRCPKPVLHLVADVVNPALKCDFLTLLPLELCQNITGHLDVKSLCSATQVSRKWRQLIDSDEQTWKRLFDFTGFILPTGELQRAIREGWGWQDATTEDCEKDISDPGAILNSDRTSAQLHVADMSLSIISNLETPPHSSANKRSKRKAASRSKPSSRKQQKRKDNNSTAVAPFDYGSMIKHVSSTDGPYAAAQAARVAVPQPDIGLPSLRGLHLYKSIYRRHHVINSNWMQDAVKPRHLAFKAHQRHVVTCLQFDTDKILTGSDDTNINVYDTQTGALRAKLEGHEGGVWALQYEGNVLVSGSTDRSVRVWDIEKGKCTHIFQGHTSTVRCLVILMPTKVGTTPDGKAVMMPKEPLIITGSRDSNLRVWKLPRSDDPPYVDLGQVQDDTDCPWFVRALTGHVHSVRAIAAYADTLVSGSYDCTVRVWKVSTGETLHRLQGHTAKVYSVVLDHDRNRCISGSMDNLVKVWSLDTGAVLYNLEGHSSLVGLLDLQQNRLVSAAADSTLRVWDPENGLCRSILSAHTGAITCFQHDGQKVVSGSDRTLKMWDIKTGAFVRDLLTDLSGVWQVKFDQRRCVAAVQRYSQTYIEVLDFGASRDGIPESKRGPRIVVDIEGQETDELHDPRDHALDLDAGAND